MEPILPKNLDYRDCFRTSSTVLASYFNFETKSLSVN